MKVIAGYSVAEQKNKNIDPISCVLAMQHFAQKYVFKLITNSFLYLFFLYNLYLYKGNFCVV